METTTRLMLPEVTEALQTDPQQLADITEELLPADLADLAAALPPELALKLLQVLPIDATARLIEAAASEELRVAWFAGLAAADMTRAVAVTDEMAADDRADLFGLLSPELRGKLLEEIPAEESRDIRQLLSYPENSAGALLTTDFVALPAGATVSEAIQRVRKVAAEMETIYQAYAVDPNGTLLGGVSLRDLVTSSADATLGEILNPNIVTVNVDADQEEVARLIAKYDLLALPVVDPAHRIVGIITVDDVMDVVEEEATEDAQKLGAVAPLEAGFMVTRARDFFKARAPWLVVLFLAEILTGNVLEHYTAIGLPQLAMLMWFVPLIISSAGNAGSQSATLVIRAMTLGEIEPRHALRILARELLIGGSLGLLLGMVGLARVLAWSATRTIGMGLTIAVATLTVVTLGAVLGAGIPLLLKRLGIDPAVSSTPFIASVSDVLGLMIYFEIARVILA